MNLTASCCQCSAQLIMPAGTTMRQYGSELKRHGWIRVGLLVYCDDHRAIGERLRQPIERNHE